MKVNNLEDIDKNIGQAFKTKKEIAVDQLHEIIQKMPNEIGNFINEAFQFQRIPKEYLFSSILFAFSNAAGLAFSINALGFTNYSNLYFAVIGSRGDQKSPAMDLATKPLVLFDDDMYNDFKIKNQDCYADDKKTDRKQMLIQDATIEAAIYCHYKNKYSVGIFVDELYFLIEKMASKNGGEGAAYRIFFLQGYTNKHIDISRKTTESFRIAKSYPTLLGSIQNQFVPKLFGNGNLESGLIDRILFTTKLTSNDKFSTEQLSDHVIKKYSISLKNLLDYRISIENSFDVNELTIELNENAKKRIFDYSQDLLNRQNSKTDISKEYMSKMLINVHKLTLLIHLITYSSTNEYKQSITLQTVETAIQILEFYFLNFQIVVEENLVQNSKLPSTEDIIKLAIKNNATQKDIVAITGMDKSSISRK